MMIGTQSENIDKLNQTTNDYSIKQEKVRLVQKVRMSLEEQELNSKKLDFLDKSVTQKEFEKYTGVSIEKMVETLTKLEDIIQEETSIMGFVEPLRKLLAYQISTHASTTNETKVLVKMIDEDVQRMLLECIEESYNKHEQKPLSKKVESTIIPKNSATIKEEKKLDSIRFF